VRLALVVMVAAACESPSRLDPVLASDRTPDRAAWSAIATRAQPLDVDAEDLERALAGFSRDKPAEFPARARALEAWATAHGTMPDAPPAPMDEADAAARLVSLASALVDAHPDDDAVVEATLYAAQRMRRDGRSIATVLIGMSLANHVAAKRPQAPAFAAAYAPTDDEAIHAFAAEAMYSKRLRVWLDTSDGRAAKHVTPAEVDQLLRWWEPLAHAPRDRAGFQIFIAGMAASGGEGQVASFAKQLPNYTRKLFDEVDRYRQWLTAATPHR
jgi:hypothetical protein